MSDMVERVARALVECHAESGWEDVLNTPWGELDDRQKEIAKRMACAVIEAMREPTEERDATCYYLTDLKEGKTERVNLE